MKKFAILKLTDLKVVSFDNEDDFRAALGQLEQNNIPNVALKWNPVSSCYSVQEQKW